MAYVEEQLLPRVLVELKKHGGDKDLIRELGAMLGHHEPDPEQVWGGAPVVDANAPGSSMGILGDISKREAAGEIDAGGKPVGVRRDVLGDPSSEKNRVAGSGDPSGTPPIVPDPALWMESTQPQAKGPLVAEVDPAKAAAAAKATDAPKPAVAKPSDKKA